MRSLVPLILLACVTGAALAQELPTAAAGNQPAVAQSPGLDTPRRGRKSQAIPIGALTARGEAALLRADTDGDGRISRADWMAHAAERGTKGRPERQFARLDLNRDGFLDKDEIDAMLARRFAKRDTNADGNLTADERHSKAAPRP